MRGVNDVPAPPKPTADGTGQHEHRLGALSALPLPTNSRLASVYEMQPARPPCGRARGEESPGVRWLGFEAQFPSWLCPLGLLGWPLWPTAWPLAEGKRRNGHCLDAVPETLNPVVFSPWRRKKAAFLSLLCR